MVVSENKEVFETNRLPTMVCECARVCMCKSAYACARVHTQAIEEFMETIPNEILKN